MEVSFAFLMFIAIVHSLTAEVPGASGGCARGDLEVHPEIGHGDVCRTREADNGSWECPINCEMTATQRAPYCLIKGSQAECTQELNANTDSYFVNLAYTEEIPSVVTTFYVHSGANNNHIYLPDGTQVVLHRGEQHSFTSQFGDVVRCSSVTNAYIETTGLSYYNVEASHSFFKGRRFAWTASRGGARFHIYADQDAVITVTESYPMEGDSARKQRGELITLNAGETYNSGTLDDSAKRTYEFMSTGDILIFTNVDYRHLQPGSSTHFMDAVNLAPASTEAVGMCANVCDVSVYGGPGSVFRHCIGDTQPTLMVENGIWARFSIGAQTYANPNAACRFYSSDGTLFNVHTHADGHGSEATALLPPYFHGMYGSLPGHTEQSTVVFVSAENNPTCIVGDVAYQLTGYAEGNPSHLKLNNVAPNTLIVCDAPVSVVSDDAVEREESNVVLFRMDHGIFDEWDLFVDLLPLRENREHTITVWSGEDYNKVLLPDGSIRVVMAGESTSFTIQTYGSLIRTATTATVHVTDNVGLNMEAAHESSAGRKFSVHTDRGIGGGYIYFYEGATVTFYVSEYNNPDSRAEFNSVTQAKGTVYQYACDSKNRVIEIESTGSIIVSQWAGGYDMIILEEVSTEWYGVFSSEGRVTTFGGAGNVYQDCFDGKAQQMVTDSNYGTFNRGPRYFQGGACRIYSTDGTLFNAVSYGDGDGGDSVQFMPLRKMGTSTVVFGTTNGVLQEYMAFVGYDTASCSIGDTTINLEKGQTDGVTFARITNVAAGTLITCDRPVMILTEERTYHKESNLHMWGMVNAGSYMPTEMPSNSPTTPLPTQQPSPLPTTEDPTKQPTNLPTTDSPSQVPSLMPTTEEPTQLPTLSPSTDKPSVVPTVSPTTDDPTQMPSRNPTTEAPTKVPSISPSSEDPTKTPSISPSTENPTKSPSISPSTENPTKSPSISPSTENPTKSPSLSPSTENPTKSPSLSPSVVPTLSPTTEDPTQMPSRNPTTEDPTQVPSISPSTEDPTRFPSVSPSTEEPTKAPSEMPTTGPTTSYPSFSPTEMPSNSCDQYVCEDALEARNYVTKDEIYPLTLQFADLLSEDHAQQQQLHELRLENENNKYRISELEANMAHLQQRLQRLEEELFRH